MPPKKTVRKSTKKKPASKPIMAKKMTMKQEMHRKHFRVAIFGSARIKKKDPVYQGVFDLAHEIGIQNFDVVVYQSAWSRVLAENMLKVRAKRSVVIHNGTKQSDFKSRKRLNGFDRVFVCCARWRVNKRLESITKAFIETNRVSDMNLALIVIGKPVRTESVEIKPIEVGEAYKINNINFATNSFEITPKMAAANSTGVVGAAKCQPLAGPVRKEDP